MRTARLTGPLRWLLPVLVALLVLGHACELPAYVDVIAHHAATTHEPPVAPHHHGSPAAAPHDDGDGHALVCEGAVVVPSHGTAQLAPVLTVAIAAPALARVAPLQVSRLPVPVAQVATGPPLYLRFSSLLI